MRNATKSYRALSMFYGRDAALRDDYFRHDGGEMAISR